MTTAGNMSALDFRRMLILPRAFVVIIFLIFLTLSRSGSAAEPVKLAIGEWAPFFSESVPGYGPVSEIVSRAFEIEGRKSEFSFRPWKRAMIMTTRGKFDGTPGWVFSEERSKDFLYSESLFEQRDLIYMLADSQFDFTSAADFAGKSTRVLIGSYIGDEFDALAKKGQLTVGESRSYEDMFLLLVEKKIDFIYLGELVGRDIVQNKLPFRYRSLIKAKNSFREPHKYYLLVSKQKKDGLQLLKTFNSGLKKLRDSGEYLRIYNKVFRSLP